MKNYKFSFRKEISFSILAVLLLIVEAILDSQTYNDVTKGYLLRYLEHIIPLIFLVVYFFVLSKQNAKWLLFVSLFFQLGLCIYDAISFYTAGLMSRFSIITGNIAMNIICVLCYATLCLWALGVINNRIVATAGASFVLLCDIICFALRVSYGRIDLIVKFPTYTLPFIFLFIWFIPFDIAILFCCLPPSKKQKYRLKVESVEQALQALKTKFENHDITEEEYELRKNEYLKSL